MDCLLFKQSLLFFNLIVFLSFFGIEKCVPFFGSDACGWPKKYNFWRLEKEHFAIISSFNEAAKKPWFLFVFACFPYLQHFLMAEV